LIPRSIAAYIAIADILYPCQTSSPQVDGLVMLPVALVLIGIALAIAIVVND
jgi:hypothetical protein